jgi:aldehyde:ferredoxin oxidoreductase
MNKYGYAGKILRVDLGKRNITYEDLDHELLKKYIGGVGFGAHWLHEKTPSDYEWSDPENRFILSCGPLNGSVIRGTGTICVVTKGAMTNLASSTQANGYMGAYLKTCGYDGVILQGAAEDWSYLLVNEEEVELRDASHLIGKDTFETQTVLLKELGKKKGVSIQCIGPAAENGVKFSVLIGDKTHTASKGGVGAVLASKKIKAIVVNRGEFKPPIYDDKQLKILAKKLDEKARSAPRHKWGTNAAFSSLYQIGCLPVRNYTTNIFPEHERMNGQYVRTNFEKVKRNPCFNCGVNHNLVMRVTEGPYKGFVGEEPEYESFAAFGPQIGQTDSGGVFILTDITDRLGMDVNEAGWVLGWLMECYDKGIVSKKDIDGLELTWGNVEAAKAVLCKIAKREGIGNILADGVKRASEKIGRGSEDMVVGTENYTTPRGHDHRARWSQIIDNCFTNTSNIEATFAELFPEKLNLPPIYDKFSPWEVPTRNAIMNGWHIIEDCLGMCRFNISDYLLTIEALNAATGYDLSLQEVIKTGKRIVNTLRVYNIMSGLDPKSEVPCARYGSIPIDGPAKGKGIMEHWDTIREIYYQLMGWDPESGKPLPGTLKELGLEDLFNSLD